MKIRISSVGLPLPLQRTSIATSSNHLPSSERKCATTMPHHVFMRSCVHAFMRSCVHAFMRSCAPLQPVAAPLRPVAIPLPPLTEANPRTNLQSAPLTASHRSKTSHQSAIHPTHRLSPEQNLAPFCNPPCLQLPTEADSRLHRGNAPLAARQRGISSARPMTHPTHSLSPEQNLGPPQKPPHTPPLTGANPRANQ